MRWNRNSRSSFVLGYAGGEKGGEGILGELGEALCTMGMRGKEEVKA